MATGFFDSNGIWNYGEDDNIALFSDTLNKLADSTSDAFTADRSRLSTLEAGSLAGLIPVVPASVVVASGSAAVNSLGTVTFTGATVISLNGVFTSRYNNYRIIFDLGAGSTGNGTVLGRFRAAGTDYSGAAYDWAGTLTRGTGTTAVTAGTAQNYFPITDTGTSNNFIAGAVFDVQLPAFSTRWTRFNILSSANDATSAQSRRLGGATTINLAFDGITFIAQAGAYTGTVTVYGYNA